MCTTVGRVSLGGLPRSQLFMGVALYTSPQGGGNTTPLGAKTVSE